jgi:transposase
VEHFELIRRMVLVDGLSEREVARRLGHSRKSIRKAIQHSSPVPYSLSEPKLRPKLDPFLPIIRQWLIDDQQKPRKQRHTATRIWERLRDEHQFTGQRRNVSDVVSMIRRELTPPEVFVPIEHPPGDEFQIDWGEATIELNNVSTKVMVFCARSAYSKATFVRAYLRDDLPSFLDAHVWLLSQLGGVPKRLAYDNLSSAVTSIGPKGHRTFTSKFTELRSHYLFETRFCNVARGNEKGHVENSVKRAERTYLTPVPCVTSLEQLNQHLHDCCTHDWNRLCSQTQRTYGELLAEERATFRELPRQPFMAASSRSQKVDRQSTIIFVNARYSVPLQYACLPVVVRSFVDRVEILHREQIIASHPRAEPGKWALKLEHYLPVLERKPGLLDSGLPFTANAWNESQKLLRRELEYRFGEEGTRQFLSIVLLVKQHPWSLVCDAIERAVRHRTFHEQAVRLELQQILSGPLPRAVCQPVDTSAYPALSLDDATGVRDLSIYDAVLNAAAVKKQPLLAQ